MLLRPLYLMLLVVVSSSGADSIEAKDLKTILQRINVLETRDQQQQIKIDLLQRIELLETRDQHQQNNIDLLRRIELLETRDQQQQNKIDFLEKQNELQENEIHYLKEREEQLANLISERCADHKTATGWTDGELARQPTVEKGANVVYEALNEAENVTITNTDQEGRAESEYISDRMHRRVSYQSIRRSEGNAEVAFTTALANSVSHLQSHQHIVFDKVLTNLGNAYNAHIGSFIAPISGVYVFSTTLMCTEIDAYFKIVRNGVEIGSLYASTTSFQSTSQTVITRLNQGDNVSIQNAYNDRMLPGGLFSTFSGFLLY